MLTLPDFKEKKIVYITPKEGIDKTIKFSGFNLCIYEDNKITSKLSLSTILAVMIIGDCTITTNIINKLTNNGVSIFFLNYNLKTTNYINSTAEGNYQLREKQYFATIAEQLEISKNLVKSKINNQNKAIIRTNHESMIILVKELNAKIENAKDFNELLAYEGFFASKYFPLMFDVFKWYRRSPQSKEDPINAILDVGYTILFNYVDTLIGLFGFDKYKGVYHREFYKRKSLVCDLMEPIRPVIDYSIVKSSNLGQTNIDKDFKYINNQFAFASFDARKKYIGIFTNAITDNKTQIYNYIYYYYRFIMNSEKYKQPVY